MLAGALVAGIREAWREKRLWLLLWIWNLALALPPALNALGWWSSALAGRPEADVLLDGFNLGIVREIAQYDRSPVWGRLTAAALASVFLALAGNPLIAGGAIETFITRDDPRPFLHRFLRGAGRLFGRYMRTLLLFLASLLLVGAAWFGLTGAAVAGWSDSEWEPAPVVLRLVQFGIFLLLGAWLLAALDYARIRLALEDGRSALRTWRDSLVFVLKRPLLALGPWAAAALGFALLVSAYAAATGRLTARSWVLICALVLLQQLFILGRCGIRAALYGAEIQVCRAACPPAAILSAPAPAPEAVQVQSENPEEPAIPAQPVVETAQGVQDSSIQGLGGNE